MKFKIAMLFGAFALALGACTEMAAVDVDPATAARIEREINAACTAHGLAKPVSPYVSMAVPAAGPAVALASATADQICADPAMYAHTAGALEKLAKEFAKQAVR